MRVGAVLTLAIFLSTLSVPAARSDELAAIRKEYADVLALEGPAKAELLAFARVLRERPAMAIDFTHLDTPQHCFKTGGDMLHVADDPAAAIPLAYLHPAEPLVKAGLDPKKLLVEPERAAELRPDTWYYYPAEGRAEPLHGKALGAPMLVRTVGKP
jgi:hypothetical protein